MFDWVIIGGGIQGITLATFLLKSGKIRIENMAIIDRHKEPLANWKSNTNVISMPFLRSPFVHHLDFNPFSLQSFAKKGDYAHRKAFYGPYKRPSLELFNEHCDQLIKETSIHDTWIQGNVTLVTKTNLGFQISLKDGKQIHTKKLVLAIGIGEQLNIPNWAFPLIKENRENIYHIFDKDIPSLENVKGPITIIGGGITSAHLALKLCELFPSQVTLVKRHPFRIHDFDSDPGWLGPKKQESYHQIKCFKERRKEIIAARNKGSIPRDIYMKMKAKINKGLLSVKDIEVESGEKRNKEIFLFDKDNNLVTRTNTVLLATGYLPSLPEKGWLDPLIESLQLPCSECGYPIVSEGLQWKQDLYVVGALAELEMGPIARNISGARQAAERIIKNM